MRYFWALFLISCGAFAGDGGVADAGPYVGGAVFVDGVVGNDLNLGTSDSPVATIAKGVEIAGDIQYARHMVFVYVAHNKRSNSLDYNETIVVEDEDLVRLEIVAAGGNAGGIGATGNGLVNVLGFRSEDTNGGLAYLKLQGFRFTDDVSFATESGETVFLTEGALIDNCQLADTLSVSQAGKFRVNNSILYDATTITNARVFELFDTRAQSKVGPYMSFTVSVDGSLTYPAPFNSTIFRVRNSYVGNITSQVLNSAAYKPQVEISEDSTVYGVLSLESDFHQYDGLIWAYSGSSIASGNTLHYWGGKINIDDIAVSGSVVHYSTYYPEWLSVEPDTGVCTTAAGLRGHCTRSMDSDGDCGCSL